MQIEKAYLFGRQLSAGEAPSMPDNVFFENGVFNPKYIPQGFDFNNKRDVTICNSTYDDFYTACTTDFEDGDHAAHLDDGTTFVIKTDNSADESFVLDSVSGCLVFEYPIKRTAPSWDERVVRQCYVIPAVGFNSGDINNVYVRLKTTSTKCPGGYVTILTQKRVSETSVYGDDIYAWEYEHSYNQTYDIWCMTGYTDGEMDFFQIWFDVWLHSDSYPVYQEGDDPFRVEIDKIWVT